MPVRFRCPCGAILVAEDSRIDTVRPCPQCHTNLRVPAPPPTGHNCVVCKKPVPASHTIWVRGHRLCWQCMPPGSVHLDLNAFREHRAQQQAAIQKGRRQGLHHFQYHAPFQAMHSRMQAMADELVLDEKEWERITPAWSTLGLIPFDMGNFIGVSLNVERFRARAEESHDYIEPLAELVKLSEELPMASVPKADAATPPPQPAPGSAPL
jgi:hypothetical protein